MAAVAAGLQGRRYKKAPQTRRTSLDRPPSPTPPPPAALLSAPSAPPAAPSPGDPAAARAGFPAGAPPAQVQDKPDTHILPSVPGAPLTSHHISHPTRIAPTLECTELKASAFEATRLADVDRPRNTRAQTVLKALRGAHSLTPANPALACLIPRGVAIVAWLQAASFFLSIWQTRLSRYLGLRQIIFQARGEFKPGLLVQSVTLLFTPIPHHYSKKKENLKFGN